MERLRNALLAVRRPRRKLGIDLPLSRLLVGMLWTFETLEDGWEGCFLP
jgi:hypothetical protein